MPDIRNAKTDEAVKGAMLALLQKKPLSEIGMAELARQAGVSRSTLYVHYGNVHDVFQALVADFVVSVRSLPTQLRCDGCEMARGKRPFCIALREAGEYEPLVKTAEFLPTYLDLLLSGLMLEEALAPYLSTGVTVDQARALFVFQMTGCYTAATTLNDARWKDSQRIIDQFIRGGFNALRNA